MIDAPASDTAAIVACRRMVDMEFVRSLKGFDVPRVVALTVVMWVQLIGAWAVALLGPWWAILPAAVVVVVCQQAMVLWVHEGSHFTLHPSRRINDLWVDLFFATPVGINVWTYRTNHLTHHTSLGTEDDLDRWTFAFDLRGWRALVRLLEFASGWHGIKVACKKYGTSIVLGRSQDQERAQPSRLLMAAAWNLSLFGLCVLAGRWWLYFAIWLYPLLSVTVLLNVLRTAAEHQPARYDGDVGKLCSPPIVRTTIPPFWQKWGLYQTNFNYHLEHHTFPYVPFFNLPRLHQHLVQRGFYSQHPELIQTSALALFARAV